MTQRSNADDHRNAHTALNQLVDAYRDIRRTFHATAVQTFPHMADLIEETDHLAVCKLLTVAIERLAEQPRKPA